MAWRCPPGRRLLFILLSAAAGLRLDQEEYLNKEAPDPQTAKAPAGTVLMQMSPGVMTLRRKSHLHKRECVEKAACVRGQYRGGRLGNHLYVLGALLDYARQQNLCYVSTRGLEDGVLRAVLDLPEVVDVASGKEAWGAVQCARKCSLIRGCGQWRQGHQYIVRSEMQRLVAANRHRTRCSNSSHPALGPKGIVMHMRSGDIMKESARPGYYSQPPCAFYLRLAEHGNNGMPFESVLIVTERDRRNPCIKQVLSHGANVEVQTSNITEDACKLILAQNLAISMGTFGPALASLNSNLRNLHVPFGEDHGATYETTFDNTDKSWYRTAVTEAGLPGVAQHVHSFPEFNATWSDWPDRVAKMVDYPAGKIVVRCIPMLAAVQSAGVPLP